MTERPGDQVKVANVCGSLHHNQAPAGSLRFVTPSGLIRFIDLSYEAGLCGRPNNKILCFDIFEAIDKLPQSPPYIKDVKRFPSGKELFYLEHPFVAPQRVFNTSPC